MIFGLVVLEFYMQTLLYANLEIQKIIVHAFIFEISVPTSILIGLFISG